MMRRSSSTGIVPLAVLVASCATHPDGQTLAGLHDVPADVAEVDVADSLDRAMQSYRRFLDETPQSAMTPEAMRRLADLQIEKAYGLIGDGQIVELPAPPESAFRGRTASGDANVSGAADVADLSESERDFEARTTEQHEFAASATLADLELPADAGDLSSAGPIEAIRIYQRILTDYPSYERNDQVLYQMARAYDEVGQPDEAMAVMERLVESYGYSEYLDEVHFRRGEYLFARRQFRAAEDAYEAIIAMGPSSSYHELALYKLGWALYKQELYEDALHRFMALLDYKLSIGYDFDQAHDEEDERRVADTYRVISLSFSNLGGPEVLNQYFSAHGGRSYEDRIYGNLGEFYLSKLRYNDAATVYKSFVETNPFHRVAPRFSMRVTEIYAEGGFPLLVVESKKEFARQYGLQAEYWHYFDAAESPEVLRFLKTNLTDLANHYHALYQEEGLADERPANFNEASLWYREFLSSFPADAESPSINYQLADLLLEHEDFGTAAREYERTAYEYAAHDQASAAGYAAVFAHREHFEVASAADQPQVKQAMVASSLKFADAFPEHEQAPVVLGSAADDLYAMSELETAITAARKLIDRYPAADGALLRSAWTVAAHASFDLGLYADAEAAYARVLGFVPEGDEARAGLVDNLAASIYQQGEQANQSQDYRAAADHFLRIKDSAPTSDIRPAAEYDAAAALVRLEDWPQAAAVLEGFRSAFPEHELRPEATKQLASVYRRAGQIDRSAGEYERVAAESTDPALRSEALLLAGELYEEAGRLESALDVYVRYVDEFPRPLDIAQETRFKVAGIHETHGNVALYHETLGDIVAADAAAGIERTDRSRYLAAQSALVLSRPFYERFAEVELVQPFEQNLAEKQQRMNAAMRAYEDLVAYEVGEVTAAATYYIAEVYLEFSQSLLSSERPAGLGPAELADYELAIEEEAFPFEEQAIAVHERNFELIAAGAFNPWVQRSLDKLAQLMPGRYAKHEISSGFIGSIDAYAYRSPNAPETDVADTVVAPAPGEPAAELDRAFEIDSAGRRVSETGVTHASAR